MKPPARDGEFQDKLRLLRPHLSIQGLATYLGQEKWQICNWLYRDKPSRWAMKALLPKINRKLTQLQKEKHDNNQTRKKETQL